MAAREPLNTADAGGCADGSWGPPPAPVEADEPISPMTVCQFFGAMGAVVLALPAIIGAWCWPMVLAAIFNVGASVMNGGSGTGVVDFFHGLQVAIMMTLMLNLAQFIYWTCKQRRTGTFWQVHTPTMTVLLSAILVNIQPLWILVIGSWKLCCADCSLFKLTGDACPSTGMSYPPWSGGVARECSSGGNVFWDISYCSGQNYAIFPTQPSGWAIQIICTWGGYILMFIGVFQATQLHKKMGAKWKAIRRGQQIPR